jgi:hypothetical protein
MNNPIMEIPENVYEINQCHKNSRLNSQLFWSKMGFKDNVWDEKV